MNRNSGTVAAFLLLLSVLTVGCQTWQRKPIDVGAVVRDWQQSSVQTVLASSTVEARAGIKAAGGGSVADGVDVTDGVDVVEAARIGAFLHPSMRVAAAEAAVAVAGTTAAGRWADPQLTGAGRQVADAVPTQWQIEMTLGLAIPLSTRPLAASAAARAGAVAAAAKLRLARRGQQRAVRKAWLRWSASARLAELLRAHAKAVAPLLKSVEVMAAAGEVGAAQAGAVGLSGLLFAQQRARVAAQAVMQRRAVLRAMGLRPSAPATLRPSLTAYPSTGEAAPAAALLANAAAGGDEARIRQHHPGLQMILARYEQREQQLRQQVARQLPTLVIGPNLERGSGQLSVGLGVGLGLPLLNGNVRAIAQARARRNATRLQVVATVRTLLADADDGRTQLGLAAARLKQVDGVLVPATSAVLERLSALQTVGEQETVAILQALQRARDARVAQVKAQLAVGLAEVELHTVVHVGESLEVK